MIHCDSLCTNVTMNGWNLYQLSLKYAFIFSDRNTSCYDHKDGLTKFELIVLGK